MSIRSMVRKYKQLDNGGNGLFWRHFSDRSQHGPYLFTFKTSKKPYLDKNDEHRYRYTYLVAYLIGAKGDLVEVLREQYSESCGFFKARGHNFGFIKTVGKGKHVDDLVTMLEAYADQCIKIIKDRKDAAQRNSEAAAKRRLEIIKSYNKR